LKLNNDKLLFSFASSFNLRRYSTVAEATRAARAGGRLSPRHAVFSSLGAELAAAPAPGPAAAGFDLDKDAAAAAAAAAAPSPQSYCTCSFRHDEFLSGRDKRIFPAASSTSF
jgi:hypothetical protein